MEPSIAGSSRYITFSGPSVSSRGPERAIGGETMSRKMLIGIMGTTAAIAGMMVASGSVSAGAFTRSAVTPLAGSVAPFTSHAKAIGDVAGSTELSVQVWLTPRLGAAQDFAVAVSTPGSRLFHHYLSPEGYSARY